MFLGDSASAERAMERLKQSQQQIEHGATTMGRKWTAAGDALIRKTAPIAVAIGGSAKAFGDFDSAMTQSTAIMGDISGPVRQKMEDAAKAIGRTTRFSAAEAAEGYFFLAAAGMDAEQSIAALPQVAAFAQAGMFDMARATDLATDAQSALGLSSDDAAENLEGLTRVTDVLVKANTLANASVEQFSEALTEKAGTAMKSVNMDIEEGVAVLGVFADQGIKGSAAGTAFTATLEGLTRGARTNRDEFERLGIQVYDTNGALRPMDQIVTQLERSLGGLSVEQQRAELAALGFNRQSQAGILALIGSSDALREYEGELRNAGGTVQEIAEKQLESFNAQMGLARDRIVTAAIDIGATVAPVLANLAGVVATGAEAFAGLPGPVRNTAVSLGMVAVAAGPVLKVGGSLLSTWGKVATALADAGGVATVFNRGMSTMVVGAANLVDGTSSLYRHLGNVARFMTGPWGLAIAGATLAIGAFVTAKREQRARIEEVIATLDDETGALTDNTNAWITNSLQESGALEHAATLGLAKGELTRALQGESDALAAVNAALEENLGKVGPAGDAAFRLTGIFRDRNHEITAAQEAWRAEAEEAASAEGKYLDVAHAIRDGLDPATADMIVRAQDAAAAAAEHSDAQSDLADEIDGTTESTDDLIDATQEYLDQVRAATDPVFALTNALGAVETAQDAYNEAVKEYGAESAEAKAASIELARSVARAEAAALNGELSFSDFEAQLRTWVTQGHLTEEQAAAIRDRVDEARTSAETFAAGDYAADVSADATGAFSTIAEVQRRLNQLGATVRIDGAGSLHAGVRHSGGVIDLASPGRWYGLAPNERVTVLEVGEEVLTADDPRHRRNVGGAVRYHTGGIAGRSPDPAAITRAGGGWGTDAVLAKLDAILMELRANGRRRIRLDVTTDDRGIVRVVERHLDARDRDAVAEARA